MQQARIYASTDVEVTGKTRVFGIIGDPVSHSLSPLFQSRFAQQHDIDAVYVPLRVAEGQVKTALDGFWASGIEGFNVTVPHKETVAGLVEMDDAARLIGAVNTVRRGPQGWQGANTDWQGVRDALHALQSDISGTEVLLIGAGGTARAVLHALAGEKAGCVWICNRSEQRLQDLLQHASDAYPGLDVHALAWDKGEIEAAAQHSPLVINTTSIGLGEAGQVFPFEIGGEGVALDVVYKEDGRTPFVLAARKGGRRVIDGLPMLLAQGAASFNWWHGVHPDVADVMTWLEARLGRCRADRLQ